VKRYRMRESKEARFQDPGKIENEWSASWKWVPKSRLKEKSQRTFLKVTDSLAIYIYEGESNENRKTEIKIRKYRAIVL
jgi:hypothetical protein